MKEAKLQHFTHRTGKWQQCTVKKSISKAIQCHKRDKLKNITDKSTWSAKKGYNNAQAGKEKKVRRDQRRNTHENKVSDLLVSSKLSVSTWNGNCSTPQT